MNSDESMLTESRDALNEGYRVVAHHLDLVLADVAPGVVIGGEPMRKNDSLRGAADSLRKTLTWLRTEAIIPSYDFEIECWGLGFLNGREHRQFFVTPAGIDGCSGDWDLDAICDLLRHREMWTPNDWVDCIQTPVMERHAAWQDFYEGIESDDLGVALFDVFYAMEEDDVVATQYVREMIDSKKVSAKKIGKCPIDGRKALYGLSEILTDVAKNLGLNPKEKSKLRRQLRPKLRAPRN